MMLEVRLKQNIENLQKGHLSPSQLLDQSLTRIEKYDPTLNAFISLQADQARERAKKIEQDWKRSGKGKLAGVPLAIKDNMLKAGTRTTCGSKILESFVAPIDATVVKRLEKEGAILVGKLNMDEFAMGSSNEHSAYGSVKNPWGLDRVPGGSSGGSAVAVTASYVGASLGSDTGGSIRQPAALCGLVGLKPTYGRVSRFGLIAFASSLDQIGPLTWTVDDAALMLEVLAGEDPLDSTSSARPVPEYSKLLQEQTEKGFRPKTIGVPESFIKEGLDATVERNFRNAIQLYKDWGYKVVPIELPHAKYAIAVYYIIATSEASSNLARFDGVRYGLRAKEVTSIQDLYRRTRAQGFGEEVKLRIMLGNFSLSSGYYDAYYKKAAQVRSLIARDFDEAFKKCDVILTPTAPSPAFRFGEKTADPLKMYLSDVFTVSINLAGVCAMSLSCGLSENGLPIGMQLIAPRFEEMRLFEAGAHFQQNTTYHQLRPPLFGGAQAGRPSGSPAG